MLKVSMVMAVRVFEPKPKQVEDYSTLTQKELSTVGNVHQVVFAPSGKRVVGFLVRRPDVGGMIKRRDAFLALDSFVPNDLGLVVTRKSDGLDEAAIERLGLNWDACILWRGMDARTSDGKDLGWVSDVEFNATTGEVRNFLVSDGAIAQSLVGNVVIPKDMLIGYQNGYMVVDAAVASSSLDGGLAARAGEGYARAKQGGKQAAQKVGKTAGDAVEKGAYGLGRMIGKAKKKSVGEQLGRTKGMFGAFMKEYKKASK